MANSGSYGELEVVDGVPEFGIIGIFCKAIEGSANGFIMAESRWAIASAIS